MLLENFKMELTIIWIIFLYIGCVVLNYILIKNLETSGVPDRIWTVSDRFGCGFIALLGPIGFAIAIVLSIMKYLRENRDKPSKW